MPRHRLVLAAFILAAIAIAAPAHLASAQEHAPAQPAAAQPHDAKAQPHEAAKGGAESHGEEGGHDAGWMPTIWKAANFALLVGALVYFLRAPVSSYLQERITKVREDIVTAKQTRETAERQLAEIDAKVKALPAEIEALKRRGAEDIVSERARIEQAAAAERERLLDHTRREIDMRLRVAKRDLLELTANLAVGVASDRIKRSITPDDQTRLVDRYASQIAEASPEQGRGASPERSRGETRQ